MANKLNRVVNKPKGRQKPVPVKIVSDTASTLGSVNRRGIDKYEAQDALRTLQRAAEIKSNKALMKAAKTEAKNQMKNLSKVCS